MEINNNILNLYYCTPNLILTKTMQFLTKTVLYEYTCIVLN